MRRELVSVILPTYNRKEFVRDAVESVLQQTYDEFELIVIDGGSDDGTVELLQSIEDDRLELVTHDQPRGLSTARNVGIEVSTGEYLIFLDDDDRLYENAISTLVETIRDQPRECGGVYAAQRRVYESGNQTEMRISSGKVERYENAIMGGPSGTLIRRAVIDEIGPFDESLPASEDTDLWVRLFSEFYMIALDQILHERRYHEDQMTRDHDLMVRANKRLVEKHAENVSDNILAGWYVSIAERQAGLGRTKQARANFRNAISCGRLNEYTIYYLFWLHFGSPGYRLGKWGARNVWGPIVEFVTSR